MKIVATVQRDRNVQDAIDHTDREEPIFPVPWRQLRYRRLVIEIGEPFQTQPVFSAILGVLRWVERERHQAHCKDMRGERQSDCIDNLVEA